MSNIIKTVGTSGDYPTINAALNYIISQLSLNTQQNNTYTISLLPGFTMNEQVIIKNLDLSCVTISASDSIVNVQSSSFAQNVDGFYAAFIGINSFLPTFGNNFIFNIDNSIAVNNIPYGGIYLTQFAKVILGDHFGSKAQSQGNNTSFGITANIGSQVFTLNANLDFSNNDIGLYILNNASGYFNGNVVVDNCKYGVRLFGDLTINSNLSAKNCSNTGVQVNIGSTLTVNVLNAINCGSNGLNVNSSTARIGTLNARRGTSDSMYDIEISGGSYLSYGSTPTSGGTNVNTNVLTPNGIIIKS